MRIRADSRRLLRRFWDKLYIRETKDAVREAWLKLSEQSLTKVWDNADDDVFNELLSN